MYAAACSLAPRVTSNATAPGGPWQTPFVESFHARMRDELLNVCHEARAAGPRRRQPTPADHASRAAGSPSASPVRSACSYSETCRRASSGCFLC